MSNVRWFKCLKNGPYSEGVVIKVEPQNYNPDYPKENWIEVADSTGTPLHAPQPEQQATNEKPWDNLKSCPFCGSDPYCHRTVNGTSMLKVGCAACGFEFKTALIESSPGGELKPTKDIIALWNTRFVGVTQQMAEQLGEEMCVCGHRIEEHRLGYGCVHECGSGNRDCSCHAFRCVPTEQPGEQELRVEVGKCYQMRDGDLSGPLKLQNDSDYPFTDDKYTWTSSGTHCIGEEGPGDLVCVAPPAETVEKLVEGEIVKYKHLTRKVIKLEGDYLWLDGWGWVRASDCEPQQVLLFDTWLDEWRKLNREEQNYRPEAIMRAAWAAAKESVSASIATLQKELATANAQCQARGEELSQAVKCLTKANERIATLEGENEKLKRANTDGNMCLQASMDKVADLTAEVERLKVEGFGPAAIAEMTDFPTDGDGFPRHKDDCDVHSPKHGKCSCCMESELCRIIKKLDGQVCRGTNVLALRHEEISSLKDKLKAAEQAVREREGLIATLDKLNNQALDALRDTELNMNNYNQGDVEKLQEASIGAWNMLFAAESHFAKHKASIPAAQSGEGKTQ